MIDLRELRKLLKCSFCGRPCEEGCECLRRVVLRAYPELAGRLGAEPQSGAEESDETRR